MAEGKIWHWFCWQNWNCFLDALHFFMFYYYKWLLKYRVNFLCAGFISWLPEFFFFICTSEKKTSRGWFLNRYWFLSLNGCLWGKEMDIRNSRCLQLTSVISVFLLARKNGQLENIFCLNYHFQICQLTLAALQIYSGLP